MTQNYSRPMNPMPTGMPIIPPRFQQQQQQQLVEHHRRQMQYMQHMQHRQPEQPMQQRQNQHQHQHQYQHQHQHHMQGSLPIQGNHNRSVSNGSNRATPLLNGHSPSNSSSNNSSSNNSSSSNSSSNSNGPSGSGSNGHSTHKQTNIHLNGRLRSESNPAYSHSHNNTRAAHHTTDIANNHFRTKSNGSNGVGNSSSSSSSNDGYQSRPPATTTRSNTTGSSFQERMRERDREKRQREREEREAAAKAIDPKLDEILSSQTNATTATPAQSTGTTIWNKFLTARDVLTGGERWPDSDDSDYEGETHVSRVLREYADKKAVANMAAKIAELEMAPTSPTLPTATLSKVPSNGTRRNRYPRDAGQRENDNLHRDLTSNNDYYGQSLLIRGESGRRPPRSEESSVAAAGHGIIKNKSNSSVSRAGGNRLGNRFRTSSDASLSEALGRLEGKRNQDALVMQVSHLGSTRARSPHRGHRAFKENIDEVPPPPLPTPKSNFRQQLQQQQSFTSLKKLNDLGTYGERLQQLQQQSR